MDLNAARNIIFAWNDTRDTRQHEAKLYAFIQNSDKKVSDDAIGALKEYGINYDPMIPDVNLQGGYRAVLNEILRLEINSFLQYRTHTYNQGNNEFRETMRAISDTKLGHILTILAIITNLNAPQNNG